MFKILKLLVIIILIIELIIFPKTLFINIFCILMQFIINEIIMKGEDFVKKLMKNKKAPNCYNMEIFD